MTIEEARAQLAIMVVQDSAPALTDEELDALLLGARRPDAQGRIHSDDDWVPTWNLNAAAADGWTLKAGKCADLVDMAVGDLRMSNSKLHDRCVAAAANYRKRLIGSIPVESAGLPGQEPIPWP